jgi:two-component system, sensor histidine kinase and response regulator
MTPEDIAMKQDARVASVLVVEDTIESLRLLTDLLDEQGYEVRAVTNGRQALQAVEQDPPDLILLDINMPELDGYEVCRRLRASDRSKDVPVIFITALTDTADMVRAFDTGGVDYVTKPFQVEEVLARVKTHLALRRAQTELADSYARLRALEHLRDDLVHMVIHDLRSPMTALLMELRFVKRSAAALSEDDRDALQSALEAAEAINRMTNDVLDVSRLEACKMPVERAVWDLTQMAREVRSALGTIDLDRTIDIESAGAVEVTCDGALVRRVMENLVSNGIRYSPAGSRMRLSIASAEGSVRVAVHDQGPGVPPEAREKIFEKFGTVGSQHQSTYHSVGLGLAFCKLAIEAQGGTIGVDPGVPAGSTFWFELPATPVV